MELVGFSRWPSLRKDRRLEAPKSAEVESLPQQDVRQLLALPKVTSDRPKLPSEDEVAKRTAMPFEVWASEMYRRVVEHLRTQTIRVEGAFE